MRTNLSTSKPTISVIIPVHNAAQFLAATLDCVFRQSYQDFEIIAINDGSVDASATILADWAHRESRLRVIHQPNQGVAAARNRAIAAATGEFIAPLDADDLWHPDFLAQHVKRHIQSPQLGVSYCWSVDIDTQDRWTGGFQAAFVSGNVHNTMLCHYFLGNGSCSLIRRDLLQTIEGYRTDFGHRASNAPMGHAVCEDWDLYLRLAEYGPFGVVPQFLVGYRKHTSSASQTIDRMRYWHHQLLAERQRRALPIRRWIYQLSARSFERYLQQQTGRPGAGEQCFPGALRWPWRDRLELWQKLGLAQLLHWLVKIRGQRHHQPTPYKSVARQSASDAATSIRSSGYKSFNN